MKTAKRMQAIITKIAEKHHLDLTKIGSHLKLEKPNYLPLVIEVIDTNQVAVSHFFIQNGDVMYDPEIVFFTGYAEWIVMECTQHPVGAYHKVLWLKDDCLSCDKVSLRGVAEITALANPWATNIREQRWLQDGIPALSRNRDDDDRAEEAA